VKLAALKPKLTTDLLRFLCPACKQHNIVIPLTGEHAWQHTGTVETLTVTPSIDAQTPPCRWHGWIRNGELVDA